MFFFPKDILITFLLLKTFLSIILFSSSKAKLSIFIPLFLITLLPSLFEETILLSDNNSKIFYS